jgi:hypothetical protein
MTKDCWVVDDLDLQVECIDSVRRGTVLNLLETFVQLSEIAVGGASEKKYLHFPGWVNTMENTVMPGVDCMSQGYMVRLLMSTLMSGKMRLSEVVFVASSPAKDGTQGQSQIE